MINLGHSCLTILIKVILVGNPMHHPRIKEMYMGQLRDCNNKPEVEGDE